MAVNGKGVWMGMKFGISQMLRQQPHAPSGDRGWIINISSIAGLIGLVGTSAYSATKGAVLQMTKAGAVEYAKDRIHINCRSLFLFPSNPVWLFAFCFSLVNEENTDIYFQQSTPVSQKPTSLNLSKLRVGAPRPLRR
jgi:hypothetical protein